MFTKKSLEEKGRAELFIVIDSETATLSFADEIAKTPEQKKNIAIAKPLIYDIGWTIIDRKINLYEKRSFLVTETFAVPQIFNTAYYKEKRPIYLKRLDNGETELKNWNEIANILFSDLKKINYACAFNAMFDFKKAIPFTEQYIYHLYNSDYQEWENNQREACKHIARGIKFDSRKQFNGDCFQFKGIDFPMIDIWGIACKSLINNYAYKKMCLDNSMITESGKYFKTSAESTYRYLRKIYDFEEAHTAIDDAEIESVILYKAMKKGKISHGITFFPFELLGTTNQFLKEYTKGITRKHFDTVINIMQAKLNTYEKRSSFSSQLENSMYQLKSLRDERF
jgi:hypothetical protein